MKTCAVCGAQHERRPTDTATQYKRRQTCSRECAKQLIGQAKIKYDTPTKQCACCGKPFDIRPTEKPSHYKDRITCTRQCALTYRHAEANNLTPAEWIALAHAPRQCETCGRDYHRRKQEPVRDWQRRKCCSPKCATAKAETYRDKLRAGKTARAARRAPKTRKFTQRLDPRPETTPMKAWTPPQATRSPNPDPVPRITLATRQRPSQHLLRTLMSTFIVHPDLRTILKETQA